jgi:hypothetical protein
MLKAAPTIFAAAVAVGIVTPLSASAATTVAGGSGAAASQHTASGNTWRIFQKSNGFKICLDSQFEFSVCQTSPSPDDPPAVQKWHLIPAPHGTILIKNGNQCLALVDFTAGCSSSDTSQQWVRVSAGNGTVKVENKSTSPATCLDSMWTVHPCSRGDKQQVWTFAHRV